MIIFTDDTGNIDMILKAAKANLKNWNIKLKVQNKEQEIMLLVGSEKFMWVYET